MVKIENIELGEFPLLLAPMEDVSDPPFRAVCKQNGADLMYTEFISSEGLVRDAQKSLKKLDIYEDERPIGIQIFGSDLDAMSVSAQMVEAANPDLLDINYGCPVMKVVCKMAGAGILQDVQRMVALTQRVVKSTSLPVTVKTRLGWDENTKNIVEVAERLQDIGIKALSIHGRTRKQLYKGEADWSLIGEVKNNPRMHIPVFGNGDIDSPEKALDYKNRYGVDGLMIGRASIGYPWIFREIKHYLQTKNYLPPPTVPERVAVAKQHLLRSVEWKGEKLGILEMRRHYTNYFKGFPEIKAWRNLLVTTNHLSQILDILHAITQAYQTIPNTNEVVLVNPQIAEQVLSSSFLEGQVFA
ncbi:MAG: tRNA dihydrouridine synthase DusB [Sphingobacteriales bacterium]|jgi:tRNA-dihydrouridine synthase B|nr:tRNA dihydrouridine synthase DusB [Sphingobacteriales bacterium]MBP9141082.1 tRNA dihydrouridine synthase DusB [Chitinophagales bacterium]MDA0198304.1 tRNA dihydrouridine synthase DusB [Bacteroidota bacterium]MBK6890946.1 tRNA dihydrouridine synthase DusB [Sphingobacteriales bacterium]MBK7526005.1 tRNA dihydrouridine synthase DusB [Sphingobacteriales bacterium]